MKKSLKIILVIFYCFVSVNYGTRLVDRLRYPPSSGADYYWYLVDPELVNKKYNIVTSDRRGMPSIAELKIVYMYYYANRHGSCMLVDFSQRNLYSCDSPNYYENLWYDRERAIPLSAEIIERLRETIVKHRVAKWRKGILPGGLLSAWCLSLEFENGRVYYLNTARSQDFHPLFDDWQAIMHEYELCDEIHCFYP